MTPRSYSRFAAPALLAALGCSSNAATGGDDPDLQFVAFSSDFRGYHGWQHVAASTTGLPLPIESAAGAAGAGPESSAGGAAADASANVHAGTEVTIYAHPLVYDPPGDGQFRQKSIFVKEADGGPFGHVVFAMVKRGGAFNPSGSAWEWFELENHDDDTVSITWQGVGPPKGEKYGGDASGGCNVCHRACGNDMVCGPDFKLDNL